VWEFLASQSPGVWSNRTDIREATGLDGAQVANALQTLRRRNKLRKQKWGPAQTRYRAVRA